MLSRDPANLSKVLQTALKVWLSAAHPGDQRCFWPQDIQHSESRLAGTTEHSVALGLAPGSDKSWGQMSWVLQDAQPWEQQKCAGLCAFPRAAEVDGPCSGVGDRGRSCHTHSLIV